MTTSTFYIAAAYIATTVILGGFLVHMWRHSKTLNDHDDSQ